jgi:hypothetical protein
MKKNTRSVTTTKTSTVLYDSNGKIISQVRVKETKKIRQHENDSPKPDLLKVILNSFIEEKRNLKKPVRRDEAPKDIFKGLLSKVEDGEMATAFPFMFTGRPLTKRPETEK